MGILGKLISRADCTDEMILGALRNRQENAAVRCLQKTVFPSVKKFILISKGTPNDAIELFDDAVMVLILGVRNKTYKRTASLKTYLLQIVKYQWFKRRKRRNKPKIMSKEELPELSVAEKDLLEELEEERMFSWQNALIGESLEAFDNPCRTILKKFFDENKSLKVIAEEMNYKNSNVVKSQKNRCMDKLLDAVFKRIFEQQPGLVQECLAKLDGPCRPILEKFYDEDKSFKVIAEEMDLHNEAFVKAQKKEGVFRLQNCLFRGIEKQG